jgi:hypothetical protein
VSDLRRRPTHRHDEFDLGIQSLPALAADQQMLFQRSSFRLGERLHGVFFQRVIGDVLHDFHGSLFRRV